MYTITFNNKEYTVGGGIFFSIMTAFLVWLIFVAFSIYTAGSVLTGYPLIFFLAATLLSGNLTVNRKLYAFIKHEKTRNYVAKTVTWGSILVTGLHLSGKI